MCSRFLRLRRRGRKGGGGEEQRFRKQTKKKKKKNWYTKVIRQQIVNLAYKFISSRSPLNALASMVVILLSCKLRVCKVPSSLKIFAGTTEILLPFSDLREREEVDIGGKK